MLIAVTGCRGRLGQALVQLGCVPMEVDITVPADLHHWLSRKHAPDVVINCAAWTNVDEAETNRERCIAVNVRGVYNLCEAFSGRVIHLSTDFVFDGKRGPYSEKARPSPLNAYGFSKWGGEEVMRLFDRPGSSVVRTTWLYGAVGKDDFMQRVVYGLKAKERVYASAEMVGNPTQVSHLALALKALAEHSRPPAVLNLSGTDRLSRFEWACFLAEFLGRDPALVQPEEVFRAERPKQGGFKLNLARKLKLPLYSLEEGTERALWELKL